MVRILLGLITVLAAAAGFFSLKAKGTLQSAKDEVQKAQQELAAVKQSSEKALADAKSSGETLEAANAAKATLEQEVATAKAEAEKAKAELATATTQIQEKDTELADLRTKIVSTTTETSDTPAPEVTELENKVKELQTQLDEQKRVAQNLEAKASGAEQRAATLEEEKARRARGLSAPGLEGQVVAVDPQWNFVVLSVGDRQGVAPNSTLLVKRGTNHIATVRVSKVERSRSIANIIPGSGTKGASIRPGDTVIFNGGRPAAGTDHGS